MSSVKRSESAAASVTPSFSGAKTTSTPRLFAYVRTTSITCGCTAAEMTTRERFRDWHMKTASAIAVAPSYTDAFDTSIPVSSQIIVWYSKIDCKIPWLISA